MAATARGNRRQGVLIRGPETFRALWSELKAVGWTSKAPSARSLESRWKYIKPGANPDDEDSVDYFLGEESLFQHAAQDARRAVITLAGADQDGGNEPGVPVVSETQTTPDDVTASIMAEKETAVPVRVEMQAVPPTSRHNTSWSEVDADELDVGCNESTGATDILSGLDDDLNADDHGSDGYCVLDSGGESEQGDDVDEGDELVEEDAPDVDTADEEESEACADEERHFADAFLDTLGGVDRVVAGDIVGRRLRELAVDGWGDVETPDVAAFMQTPYDPVGRLNDYPDLTTGYFGPTADALKFGRSPLPLFFYFMPVALWQHISACSNLYMQEQLEARVESYFVKPKPGTRSTKTRRDVRSEFQAVKPVMPHELCVFIGLLVARAVPPNREKLSNHWKQAEEGAIPRGMFGKYLSRDRFMQLSRNLHFNSNLDPRAKSDRAWKIRSVVHVLQQTFQKGYVPPAELSFDEAMLPSRSSFNRTRIYMKDKPHKWGTKLFMLYCAHSAYCIRFEVYCGKKQHIADSGGVDMKSGPAAVIRNLKEVFGDRPNDNKMRLVVVDRFYTSVVLAVQLLLMGLYTIGTIMTNRLGFCKAVVDKRKKRPSNVPRGTITYARSTKVKEMAAICWWDSKPVHFLSVGGNLSLDRVVRRDKTGEQNEVPCPKVIRDYHRLMGGVDVHDQLRLQRYSLQRALTFRKYYKSLFLGLVDLVITNGYIVHRAFYKGKSSKALTHVQYMRKLHLQLIELTADDMYEHNTFGTGEDASVAGEEIMEAGGHVPKQVDEWREHSWQRKRVQKNCKVCALLTEDGKRGATTTYYCDGCDFPGPIALCMKPKWPVRNKIMSCWENWHSEYENGKSLPANKKRTIRVRNPKKHTASPSKSPAKRRRTDSSSD